MQFRFDNDGSSFSQRVVAAVRRNPTTAGFMTLNLLIFLFQFLVYGGSDVFVLYRMGAKFGPAIQDGEWTRLVMPIMLHSGWVHLAMNNIGLLMVGPIVERIYGSVNLAAIYVMGGIFGVVASYWNAPTLSVGASGALFGIVGATAVYFALNRDLLAREESRFFLSLLALIGINLLVGELIPGIDQAAHVGGLLGGCLIALAGSPRLSLNVGMGLMGAPEAHMQSRRPHPIRVLVALLALAAVSAAVVWWVSNTVSYGAETMRLYGIFQLLE